MSANSSQIHSIRKLMSLYGQEVNHPWLKILGLLGLGLGMALFEGVGFSFLIPVLEQILGEGPPGKISIPVDIFKPVENWLNLYSPRQQIMILGSVILSSVFLKGLFAYVNNMVIETLALKVSNLWRKKVFQAMVHGNLAKIYRFKYGDLQNVLVVECGNLRFIFRGCIQILTSLVMGSAYLAMLMYISPVLTFGGVVFLMLVGWPIWWLNRSIQRTSYNRAEARSRMGALVIEILGALKIVQLLKTYWMEEGRFKKIVEDITRKELYVKSRQSFLSPISQVAGVLLVLAITILALEVSDAGMGTSWILLFLAILSRFLPVLQSMSVSMGSIGNIIGSIEMVDKTLSRLESARLVNGKQKLERFPDEIRFSGVSFSYSNHQPAIKKLNLSIKKGEYIALVGPSGGGKSTFVSLLMRLFDPGEGEILLLSNNGSIDLREVDIESWRGMVGFVEQNPVMFNESVAYNIAYGKEPTDMKEIENMARLANADEFIKALPGGFESDVGTLGNSLSGGQRQRIAIARSLMKDPRMLILDEATSAVDSESEEAIRQSMISLQSRGVTIISVAHRISSIRDAGRFFFIDQGQIKGEGTFEELVSQNSAFRKYVSLQQMEES